MSNHGSKLSKKEKAKSFDEGITGRNYRGGGDRSSFPFDVDGDRPCRPLPLPLVSLSPAIQLDHVMGGSSSTVIGSVSTSASVSSVSSSGTDDGPDLGFHRDKEGGLQEGHQWYSRNSDVPSSCISNTSSPCFKQTHDALSLDTENQSWKLGVAARRRLAEGRRPPGAFAKSIAMNMHLVALVQKGLLHMNVHLVQRNAKH